MPIDTTPAPTLDELGALKLDQLERKHPDFTVWFPYWADYRLLYKGGNEMLAAAGMDSVVMRIGTTTQTSVQLNLRAGSNTRIPRRFLWQLEGEPDSSYLARLERAYYIGYMGPIIDYFRMWLFSERPTIRPTADDGSTPELPEWWGNFDNDCTGGGKPFQDFLRDVFLDVLLCQRAGWLIGRPSDMSSDMSQAEAEAAGVDGAVLTAYTAEEIFDWSRDEAGELEWIVLHKKKLRRKFPNDRYVVETFRYVDRAQYATWEATLDPETKQKQLRFMGGSEHSLGVVPFVMLEVPEGLWPANKLASWQLDMFNQSQILSRGQLLSCFLQPTLTTNEEGRAASGRIFGEGNFLTLRAGDATGGGEEKFAWIGGDPKPLEFVAGQLKEKRDEGYRIVHQMSLAVDSQAIGAIARSGTSKIEDRRASEIILAGYGSYVRNGIIRTANLISQVQGDGYEWVCDGYDDFAITTFDEEITQAALAETLDAWKKSPTLRKVVGKQIAGRLMDREDEATRGEVNQEIEDAVDAEADAQAEMEAAKEADPPIPQVVGTDGKPTPAIGAPITKPGEQAPKPMKPQVPSPFGQKPAKPSNGKAT